MIGERLGNWIVEAEIGQNAMGRLFRVAEAEQTGVHAALRWLVHQKAHDPTFERLFLAQIELIRKLRHPCIVSVINGGTYNGTPYYAMEWIEGTSFQTILRRGEKVAWAETLAIAMQIVPALRYAHRRSVLHRDLRPGNLFRLNDGTPKLSDFGVSKYFGDAFIINMDDALGPAAYLPPELVAGKPHSKRSDFYSLGCLLYTLIAGRPPFVAGTIVEMTHKHCYILPERPIHFVPDLPEEFDRLVMRLLAKEPAQRPASGTMLIQELEGLWSLCERRGLVGKRPKVILGVDLDVDAAAGDEEVIEPLLPLPAPRPPVPWQRRWYIVGPLFVFCVLLIVWAFWFRVPSAESLMAKARPLLESNNPADWQQAWNVYLEPLSRHYPHAYEEEVRQARRRIDDQGELNRALLAGKAARNHPDAERFYQAALGLIQAGQLPAARRLLENVVLAYSNSKDDNRWAALAKEALARLDTQLPASAAASPTEIDASAQAMIDDVARLRRSGKTGEADALAEAIEFLYRDDPQFQSIKQSLHGDKK